MWPVLIKGLQLLSIASISTIIISFLKPHFEVCSVVILVNQFLCALRTAYGEKICLHIYIYIYSNISDFVLVEQIDSLHGIWYNFFFFFFLSLFFFFVFF